MKVSFLFAVLLFTATHAPALAEEAKPAKKSAEFSREQREQMAAHHEKMAACLRSEKSVQNCREEMMESCRDKKESCPMMEMGGKRRMMHRGASKDE